MEELHIGQSIKRIVESSNIKKYQLAQSLDMTEANLHKIFNKQNVSTEVLQKIASVLGISITDFFNPDFLPQAKESNVNYIGKGMGQINQSISKGEMKCLEDLNKAQNEIIVLQKKVIELMGKNNL